MNMLILKIDLENTLILKNYNKYLQHSIKKLGSTLIFRFIRDSGPNTIVVPNRSKNTGLSREGHNIYRKYEENMKDSCKVPYGTKYKFISFYLIVFHKSVTIFDKYLRKFF